jgi:hypothetical protein
MRLAHGLNLQGRSEAFCCRGRACDAEIAVFQSLHTQTSWSISLAPPIGSPTPQFGGTFGVSIPEVLPKMSKVDRTIICIGIASLVLMAIPAWETLERWGVVTGAILILVWLVGATLLAYSVYRNLKDAHRVEQARRDATDALSTERAQWRAAMIRVGDDFISAMSSQSNQNQERFGNFFDKVELGVSTVAGAVHEAIQRLQSEHAERLAELEAALSIRPLSTQELEQIKTAGECEQLAWQAGLMRARLVDMFQTLELGRDEEAIRKLNYPLFNGYPDETEPELWKWWHRSLIKFQDSYGNHRERLLTLSLPSTFVSFVRIHALGSNHPDTNRLKLIEGLSAHQGALLMAADQLIRPYVNSALIISTVK